jgi:hypothetical protein
MIGADEAEAHACGEEEDKVCARMGLLCPTIVCRQGVLCTLIRKLWSNTLPCLSQLDELGAIPKFAFT